MFLLQTSVLGDKRVEKICAVISQTDYMDLKRQVEDLKAQLQRAEEQVHVHKQANAKVSANLESEVNENETLWNQVEFLTSEIHRERLNVRKQQARFLDEQCQRIKIGHELEEARKLKDDLKQLLVTREEKYKAQIHQVTSERDKIQEEMIQNTQIMTQCIYNKEQLFSRELADLKFKLDGQIQTNIQLMEARLKEPKTNLTVPLQMEMQGKSHAEGVKKYLEQIQRIPEEQLRVVQNMSEQIKHLNNLWKEGVLLQGRKAHPPVLLPECC